MESELYNKAMAFFHDVKLTERWLNHPSAFLGNVTPLQHSHTEKGRKEVLDYLEACTKGKTTN